MPLEHANEEAEVPEIESEPDAAARAAYSKAFHLLALLDETKTTASRLRAAADCTTGLERESNIRQAIEAEAEQKRIEGELSVVEYRASNPDTRRPMGAQRWQEQRILTALRELKYDPVALPRRVNGRPWAKAQCREQVGAEMTVSVFEKAWERLSAAKEIATI